MQCTFLETTEIASHSTKHRVVIDSAPFGSIPDSRAAA